MSLYGRNSSASGSNAPAPYNRNSSAEDSTEQPRRAGGFTLKFSHTNSSTNGPSSGTGVSSTLPTKQDTSINANPISGQNATNKATQHQHHPKQTFVDPTASPMSPNNPARSGSETYSNATTKSYTPISTFNGKPTQVLSSADNSDEDAPSIGKYRASGDGAGRSTHTGTVPISPRRPSVTRTSSTPSYSYNDTLPIGGGANVSETFSDSELRYFRKIFDTFDADKSGSLGFYEIKALCRHLGVEVADDDLRVSIDAIDDNGNGELEFDEFTLWLAELGGGAANSQAVSRTTSTGVGSPTSPNGRSLRNSSGAGDSWAIVKSKIRAKGANPISNQHIEAFREVFDHFDTDNGGTIGRAELRAVFEAMGQSNVADEEIDSLLNEVDDDGSGEIDFDEFLMLMCMGFSQGGGMGDDGTMSIENYIQSGFRAYDPHANDHITVEDLKEMIEAMVQGEMSGQEIDEVIALCPKDDHNRVCYREWKDLWDACQTVSV